MASINNKYTTCSRYLKFPVKRQKDTQSHNIQTENVVVS